MQQIVNVVVLGCVYAVVALGFSLYFGTSNLINFAHGDLATAGAFLFLMGVCVFGTGGLLSLAPLFAVAAGAAVVGCLLLGLASERFLFRPVRSCPPLYGLVISVGLSMVLRESILRFYPGGAEPQPFPDPLGLRSIQFAGARLSHMQVVLLATCLLASSLYYWIVKRTRFGRALRATSQDPEAAAMIGIRVDRQISGAFAIGAVFAAMAGILTGALYGSIKYDMGYGLGIKGFVAAVIGGLGSPSGAFVGGLFMAGLEVLTVTFVQGGSAFSDILAFTVLILMLMVRPSGLLGEPLEVR
jgi:branched-chain amino acid transport system permease protein